VREDGLEHVTHLEAWRVPLIEVDVATGKSRLVEMPDQRLFLERQTSKAVGIHLHDGCVVDPFEQVGALRGCGWSGRRGNSGRVAASAGDGSEYRHHDDKPLRHVRQFDKPPSFGPDAPAERLERRRLAREGRNNQPPASSDRVIDDARQAPALVIGLMKAIAVRRRSSLSI
jgi:hypothetical protein